MRIIAMCKLVTEIEHWPKLIVAHFAKNELKTRILFTCYKNGKNISISVGTNLVHEWNMLRS